MASDRVRVKLTVVDTLGYFNEVAGDYLFNPTRSARKEYWFNLPSTWIADDDLAEGRLEEIFNHLYGPTWRRGNGDGSRYIVMEHRVTLLGNPLPQERPRAVNADCFFYDGGRFVRVAPPDF